MKLDLCDIGAGVLRVGGELDAETAPELERWLDESGPVATLDLRQLAFVNSSGLQVLLRAARRAAPAPLRVRPSPALLRLLQLTDLLDVFCIDMTDDGTSRPIGA